MDIKQITNQIKCLDEQVKALIIIEDRPTRQEHLKIMKLHIDTLKAWAGITSNDASALPIPDVSKSLPDGFWFDDEHGTTVTVIGIVDKWCMVEDTEHDEPYALPLEYVVSIYEESKEGNVR